MGTEHPTESAARRHARLAEHPGQVCLHGPQAQRQPLGDLRVRAAFHDQPGNLELAGRQAERQLLPTAEAWHGHPLAEAALATLAARGVTRAIALPLYPHQSRTTTGSSLGQLEAARARHPGIELAPVLRYPDAEGYLQAVADRMAEAARTLPADLAATAPVLFSAHGLPEVYIQRGDPYLDDIRITVDALARRLNLGARARLCFQSRVGPQRWLGPTTEEVIDEVAQAGTKAVLVVPIAFTGEHIETLQEIDILYRERAEKAGIAHFARAHTVGTHPAFIGALADLCESTARQRGWV